MKSKSFSLLCVLRLATSASYNILCTTAFSVGVIQSARAGVKSMTLLSKGLKQYKHFHTALDSTSKGEKSSIGMIRAAVYQPKALDILAKNQKENPLEILTQVADALRVASAHSVDVILFPELYLSGGPNRVKNSGYDAALDRESYELNIVGNLCGELRVACCMGYAELKHKSESKPTKGKNTNDNEVFNSIAAFHADGSRAGNYRGINLCEKSSTFRTAIHDAANDLVFMKGHPLVEIMPVVLQLPGRFIVRSEGENTSDDNRIQGTCMREVKVGLMCGYDIFAPEHCRHLSRSGVQILLVSASLKRGVDHRAAKHTISTRAVENELPLLYSNYVGSVPLGSKEENDDGDGNHKVDFISESFSGSSSILSHDGSELVCAPDEEFGDMPCDEGYLLPCESGTLYAADIHIDDVSQRGRNNVIQTSIEQWDLSPHIEMSMDDAKTVETSESRRKRNGFGREMDVRRNKGKPRKKM